MECCKSVALSMILLKFFKFKMFFVFLLLIFTNEVYASKLPIKKGYNTYSYYGSDNVQPPSKNNEGECSHAKLTCVEKDDCELPCPWGFKALDKSGACYSTWHGQENNHKTLQEAEEYCKNLWSRLLWLESSEELLEILGEYKKENEEDDTLGIEGEYFLAAEYSKPHGSWVWWNTHDIIDWEVILEGTDEYEASIQNIENANFQDCLTIHIPDSLVTAGSCLDDQRFICKMGKAKNRCARSSNNQCCYSPTYEFYKQNKEGSYGYDYYKNVHITPGSCKVKIDDEEKDCDAALEKIKEDMISELNAHSPTRIGSSYYYITTKAPFHKCYGRDAVIQDAHVHKLVMLLMATREKQYEDIPVKIGLTYKLEDKKFYWVNGKPGDYYDTYWYPGEPVLDQSADGGCAAYVASGENSVYLWKLHSKDECENSFTLCEIPILHTTVKDSKVEKTCGVRNERGVLARSLYSVYESNEAMYGEFPWQAAVMYNDAYGNEIKRKFACSAALIHKYFVLTSAHCVANIKTKDLVVALGQHDLDKEDEGILEPVIIEVKEVILHNNYDIKQNYKYDVALLELVTFVDVKQYPHIGLVCLPTPEYVRSHAGKWECYSVGWSSNKKYHSRSKPLQRIIVDFTSEQVCSNHLRYENVMSHSYSTGYGYKPQYYSYDKELLCAKSYENECIHDSPILICKKAETYIENPFSGSYNKYSSGYQPGYSGSQPPSGYASSGYQPGYSGSQPPSSGYGHPPQDVIINAYGEDRFVSDSWHIIGLGTTLSKCGQSDQTYGHYGSSGYGGSYGSSGYGGNYHIPYGTPQYNYPKRNYQYSGATGYAQYSGATGYAQYSGGTGYTQVYTSVYKYIDFIDYVLDLHG